MKTGDDSLDFRLEEDGSSQWQGFGVSHRWQGLGISHRWQGLGVSHQWQWFGVGHQWQGLRVGHHFVALISYCSKYISGIHNSKC